MDSILHPGSPLIFMKVGTHAQETLSDIIARKKKEIKDAGYALWGYGGSTCHPTKAVQAFTSIYVKKGSSIFLCMEEINSRHFEQPLRSRYFSADGQQWEEVPVGVNVLGSKYALVLEDLEETDFKFSLAHTRVAVGAKSGRLGSDYIKGRVDKACLVATDGEILQGPEPIKSIGLVAKLAPPFAVFLKGN